MSKSRGQNFLVNPGVRKKILDILDPREGESFWEIGPGLGAMTGELLERLGQGSRVTAFEIDHGFAEFLRERWDGREGFVLQEGDFFKLWPPLAASQGFPQGILGNLPYNSGSAMLGGLLRTPGFSSRLVLTLPRETVRRICASPGSPDYSGFSVLCAFTCRAVCHGDVQPGSFYPVPRIISAVAALYPRPAFPEADRGIFFDLLEDGFASRRKTLKNNLLRGRLSRRFSREVLLQALAARKLEGVRMEELGVEELVRLCEELQRGGEGIPSPKGGGA
jgi:16S rRNA (adenine1518-N6/adenine1519-N6)-dimethyltransferase